MILLLYGPESWLIKQKLAQIVERAASQGVDDTNTAHIDGQTAEIRSLQGQLTAAPFLAKQRLVTITDWLLLRDAEESEAMAEALAQTPESTIAVIVEYGEPDQRRRAFKKIRDRASKVWHFPAVDEAEAVRRVQQAVKRRGADIASSTARQLVEEVGTDLWALSNEVDKLSVSGGTISSQKVKDLVTPNLEGNVFRMVDGIGERQANKALQEYHRLIENNEPPLKILAMVIRQFRLLISLASLIEQRQPDAAIAKALGLRPFAVRTIKRQSSSFSPTELHRIYGELAEIDEQIKTGRRDAETALELFIVEVCQGAPIHRQA